MESECNNRITLITKPEQSGKTFLMLQELVKCYSNDSDLNDDDIYTVNFIICDNNLLLVLQTGTRIEGDSNLKEYKNKLTGEIFAEFSSARNSNAKNYKEVQQKILVEDIRTIVFCANHYRWADSVRIIEGIQESKVGKNKFKYNFWIDEADKFLKPITNILVPLISKYNFIRLYLLTATSPKLINGLGIVKVFPIENPTLPFYHGWNYNKITFISDKTVKNNFTYVENILTNYKQEITIGSKWFIPSQKTQVSHLRMKDICLKAGFAVAVINGKGFSIYLPDGTSYNEKKDDFPERLIYNLYTKYELYKYPFAITGYLCISRGITINSEHFMISHAIMPCNVGDESECSQLAGRMKGNFKNWSNYFFTYPV